jgi:hypothetical protein
VVARLLLAIMAGQAVAGPLYDTSAMAEVNGARMEGTGLTTGGAYATDRSTFTMSWVITPLGGGPVHDQDTFEGLNTPPPGVSTGPKSPNISAAFHALVQWHGFQPNASGFVPLSMAEVSL